MLSLFSTDNNLISKYSKIKISNSPSFLYPPTRHLAQCGIKSSHFNGGGAACVCVCAMTVFQSFFFFVSILACDAKMVQL